MSLISVFILGVTLDIMEGSPNNSAPIGPSTTIKKSLAIMCNNAEQTIKKKRKVASLDFHGTIIHSKLNWVKKVVPIAEAKMLAYWTKRDSYMSLKTSSSL